MFTYQLPLAVLWMFLTFEPQGDVVFDVQMQTVYILLLSPTKVIHIINNYVKTKTKNVDKIDEYLATTEVNNYFLIWSKIKS